MRFLNDLIITVLIILGIAASYFYVPSKAKTLDKKISELQSVELGMEKRSLAGEYEEYMLKNLPEKTAKLYFYWFSHQRKLSDLRVGRAVDEIKNTQIDSGKIKVWSLLNMGAVVKTGGKTIAFDTANLPFSAAHNGLLDLVDVFIVSHADGDHFDPELLKKAIEKGKKVVMLEGMDIKSDKRENIILLPSGETVDIDGVKITAYQTDHRGNGSFIEPCAWFMVEVNGFKILHTGDGRDFKNKNEYNKVYVSKDIDILLGNVQLHPYNIRDLKPKVLIPLHLYKFMGDRDLYEESTIEKALENYGKYQSELKGIKIIYLLPGEGFLF